MSLSSGPHPRAGQVRATPYLPLVARPRSVPPPWGAHWPQTAQPLGTSGTERPVAGTGQGLGHCSASVVGKGVQRGCLLSRRLEVALSVRARWACPLGFIFPSPVLAKAV